jgi:NitT/TauT family transport system ATP-binding protein
MELIVEHVSHAFGSLRVLDDMSFAVASGEVLVIVGPSGCGKSTLLAIVGGLIAPASGKVALLGELPPHNLNPITFVFQDFALLPWRSAADNVALPLEHRKLAASERRALIADALQRTGLSEFSDAFPKQLSGGMRQRVGIARALAVRPALLLMDEPLSALDSQTRELLIEDLMRLLDGTELAVVYVTHNLDEALRLADRIIVLSPRPGRIQDTVAVPIPRRARNEPSFESEFRAVHARLWSLVRAGALAAEREVVNA